MIDSIHEDYELVPYAYYSGIAQQYQDNAMKMIEQDALKRQRKFYRDLLITAVIWILLLGLCGAVVVQIFSIIREVMGNG